MAKPLQDILFGNPRTPKHQVDKREFYEWLLAFAEGGGGSGGDYSDEIAALVTEDDRLDTRITQILEALGERITDETQARVDNDVGLIAGINAAASAALASAERPGDARMRFSATATGAAAFQSPFTGGTIEIVAEGAGLVVGTGITLWTRQDVSVEPGVLATAEWKVRRTINSPDPLNDTVEFGITWLDKDKQRVSAGADQSVRQIGLATSDGAVTHRLTISKDRDDADIEAPAAAVYARPYVRTYGDPAAHTAIIILGLTRGGGAAGPKGSDGLPPSYQLSSDGLMVRWSQPDGTVGPWIDFGTGAKRAETARDIAQGFASDIVSQGNVPIYGTVQGMPALTVPAGIKLIRVGGYYAIGDGGAWKWKRVDAEPTHGAKFRTTDRFLSDGTTSSANGGWWEPIADPFINIMACGAKPDWQISARTGTNNAPMVQAAMDVARKSALARGLASGAVVIPPGNFGLAATVTLPEAIKVFGAGRDISVFWRATDYGDTFQGGAAVAGANAYSRQVEIHNLSINHSLPYDRYTNANLLDKATTGAHIRLYGALKARLCNLGLSRLPQQIVSHGGTNVYVENVLFYGVWDPDNAANQEGIAQLSILYDAVHGLPTNWDVQRCYMAGQSSMPRTLSWVTGDRGTQSRTEANYGRSIGSRRGLHCTGMENGKFLFNHFGGLAQQSALFQQVAGSAFLDIDWGGNFMDGLSHGVGVLIQPGATGLSGLDFKIFENTFIDQLQGVRVDRASGGAACMHGLKIFDNVFRNMIGTPIMIGGAKSFEVYDNRISSYNRLNLSGGDVQFAFGVVIYDIAEDGEVLSNKIGGGVRGGDAPPAVHSNYPETTAPYNADPNFCWTDAFVATGLTAVFYFDNRRAKCTTKITQAAPAGMR